MRSPMRIQSKCPLFLVVVAIFFATLSTANSQKSARKSKTHTASQSICDDGVLDPATREALRLVCQERGFFRAPSSSAETIVIGFLGGFAKADDLKHPEVLFSAYLREHYSPEVHSAVFSNHDDKKALTYVVGLLDSDHDGKLSTAEKKRARIIIYGHSWGASETAAFARELGRHSIPVLLTVQLDIIAKHGQKPILISPNVERAVNFYQPDGPLHGRTTILASDPARTTIIGNFRMTYGHRSINCDNYPWFARTFNKPHHEIENDARVWDQIASLIDFELSAMTAESSFPSGTQSVSVPGDNKPSGAMIF